MNKLKRTLTGITAMVCMFSATACNSKGSVSQKEESKATQIQQLADTA